ncbi:MAG: DUF3391 domain-containing protein, partial [Chromatiales bacterium]
MLKKIHVRNLRVGMYVHDLGRIWMDHPFAMSCFLVKELQTIRKITDAGIREVVIDSTKGLDVRQSAKASVTRVSSPPAKQDVKPDRVRVSEEQGRARVLFQEATQIIRNLMRDARLGKQVELQSLEPLAARMVQSSLRSRHALTGISRIKTKDEFEVMRRHVEFSGRFLQQQVGLSPVAKEVAMLHHERMDGKGYPLGLKGQQISRVGQMAAIVDVYDALTSVRVYKAAWEPSLTLKKLLEWSPHHFNPQLVQRFIKCLGIYPVG